MRQVAILFASFVFVASASAEMPGDAPKVDLANGERIATQQCAACHGVDGNAAAPIYPKLAGQHAEYLYKQLKNFTVLPGADKAERENAVMAGFSAMLSDQDMRDVSAYFEKQTIEPGVATNKELLKLGQQIYRGGIASKNVPACAGCHSPNGAGIPAQYPRLGGQHADYTAVQLEAFRAETRNNSVQMTVISARLSDKEIKAVSDYIAGLR